METSPKNQNYQEPCRPSKKEEILSFSFINKLHLLCLKYNAFDFY